MSLLLLGLSHRTAPVQVRERYAVSPAALSGLDEKLVRSPEVDEAALLSTCNRTEILAVSSLPDQGLRRLREFFQREVGDGSAGPRHFYELRDAEMAMHVLRVSSSLDSMVLGEAQILGQVKQGYRAALEAQSLGPILNRLFQRAFRSAKRVRSETGLGAARVSVASVGVHLARQLFESLDRKKILLLGAGEMAEAALHGLEDAGAEDLVILSRTLEAATRLVERLSGRPDALDAIPAQLVRVDVVLCSLQVDHPILEVPGLEQVMRERQGRPLLIIDLGMPRNVAPGVNELENVYLYDLDDLEQVAEQGRAERASSAASADGILRQELEHFEHWQASLALVPTIRELLERSHTLARAEARRLAHRFPGPAGDRDELLDRLAEGIVAKVLHQPLERLRAESAEGGGLYYADAVQRLFALGAGEEGE